MKLNKMEIFLFINMSAFSRIYINISILFTEPPLLDIAEKTLCSDPQETVEEISKSDSEKLARKEHNTGKIL